MGKDERTVEQVISQAQETLKTAKRGYKDFVGDDPERRLPGLRNAIVFGRAVTNVIENLRGRVPDFDLWYKPWSRKLAEDPGFRRLYQLRSEVLKQGASGAEHTAHLHNVSARTLAPVMSNPPAWAKSFFIGDSSGGSGWEVELPSGEVEPYYVSLPIGVATLTHTIDVAGEAVEAGPLLSSYLASMEEIIMEAKARFSTA